MSAGRRAARRGRRLGALARRAVGALGCNPRNEMPRASVSMLASKKSMSSRVRGASDLMSFRRMMAGRRPRGAPAGWQRGAVHCCCWLPP